MVRQIGAAASVPCPSSFAMCQCFLGEKQQFVPALRVPDQALAGDGVEDAIPNVLQQKKQLETPGN